MAPKKLTLYYYYHYYMICHQLADVEKSSGSVDLLQQQLVDVKSKLEDSERLVQQKQDV